LYGFVYNRQFRIVIILIIYYYYYWLIFSKNIKQSGLILEHKDEIVIKFQLRSKIQIMFLFSCRKCTNGDAKKISATFYVYIYIYVLTMSSNKNSDNNTISVMSPSTFFFFHVPIHIITIIVFVQFIITKMYVNLYYSCIAVIYCMFLRTFPLAEVEEKLIYAI